MKKHILPFLCALPLFHGCLDIKLDNQFSDPYAITTAATARELLVSAYNSLPRYQMEFSIMGDDFIPTKLSSRASNYLNIYNWQEKALDDFSTQVWNEYYIVVAYLNTLLPRLGNIDTEDVETASEVEKIRSEALALKAYCYFDLLRLYAPAYSDANLQKDGIILKDRLELDFLPRSSVKECADEIDSLLSEAAKIQNTDPSVYFFGTEAVNALRAEFELYRGKYGKAVEYGLPLLADAESRWTETEYNNLWTAQDSRERLFAPYIFDAFYTDLCDDRTEGDYFRLSDAVSYDGNDIRKRWCEYQGPMDGVRSLGKYNRMYYENTEVRYINTIRYSGVCFTVAEAYARDGNPVEARALMNMYLESRGIVQLDESLEGEALVLKILDEKQKEFVGEGTRYFDLKRLGGQLARKDDSGSTSAVIKPDDYRWLLPIPQSEYKYNDSIKESNQNPGWPYEKTE